MDYIEQQLRKLRDGSWLEELRKESAQRAGNNSSPFGKNRSSAKSALRAGNKEEEDAKGVEQARLYAWRAMLNVADKHSVRVFPPWRRRGSFDRWLRKNGWRRGLKVMRVNREGSFRPKNTVLVTHEQYAAERKRRGRMTVRDAADIRKLLAEGARQVDLAREYGVSRATINKIARRKTFRDVRDEFEQAG